MKILICRKQPSHVYTVKDCIAILEADTPEEAIRAACQYLWADPSDDLARLAEELVKWHHVSVTIPGMGEIEIFEMEGRR